MVETKFVAKAIVRDVEGNFLCLTRSDTHPSLAGLYDLPGGMVEDGEEPGQAIMREIKEETNLDVSFSDIKVLYAITMFLGEHSYPTLLYHVQLDQKTPEVILSFEHKQATWKPLEKLTEIEPQIAPTYRDALAYLKLHDIISY